MNRERRRKEQKSQKTHNAGKVHKQVMHLSRIRATVPGGPDFSSVPLATICQSIQLLINELKRRGISVYDFDHKDKSVQQIQILRGRVYFLAVEEDEEHEKV